jgi:hypothetical protein
MPPRFPVTTVQAMQTIGMCGPVVVITGYLLIHFRQVPKNVGGAHHGRIAAKLSMSINLEVAMKHKVLLLPVLIVCLSKVETVAAQDSTGHSASSISFCETPLVLGGDLFTSIDAFAFHFNAETVPFTAALGFGVEVRVNTLFLGGMLSVSSNEGIVRNDLEDVYPATSVYGGMMIGKYRLEVGEIHAWVEDSSIPRYTSIFVGASRRFGGIFMFEPEVRVVFPVNGTFVTEATGGRPPATNMEQRHVSEILKTSVMVWPPPTIVEQRLHFRDIFFGFGVKLGIGYN